MSFFAGVFYSCELLVKGNSDLVRIDQKMINLSLPFLANFVALLTSLHDMEVVSIFMLTPFIPPHSGVSSCK